MSTVLLKHFTSSIWTCVKTMPQIQKKRERERVGRRRPRWTLLAGQGNRRPHHCPWYFMDLARQGVWDEVRPLATECWLGNRRRLISQAQAAVPEGQDCPPWEATWSLQEAANLCGGEGTEGRVGNLNKDVQEALKGVGIDFTSEPELQPQDVLKAHLEALPKEVKDFFYLSLRHQLMWQDSWRLPLGNYGNFPTRSTPSRSGLTRPRSTNYKVLLDELKVAQEAIDREHKQLGDQSAEYANQLKKRFTPQPPRTMSLTPTRQSTRSKRLGRLGSFSMRSSRKGWKGTWLRL